MLSVVSTTWNGTTIIGPVLIFSDDLPMNSSNDTIGDPNGPGVLICSSEDRARVSWHYVNGAIVRNSTFPDTFKQVRTGEGVTPSISQLSLNRENVERSNSNLNGVWHCRLNGALVRAGYTYDEQINVAIFSRGEGKFYMNKLITILNYIVKMRDS